MRRCQSVFTLLFYLVDMRSQSRPSCRLSLHLINSPVNNTHIQKTDGKPIAQCGTDKPIIPAPISILRKFDQNVIKFSNGLIYFVWNKHRPNRRSKNDCFWMLGKLQFFSIFFFSKLLYRIWFLVKLTPIL